MCRCFSVTQAVTGKTRCSPNSLYIKMASAIILRYTLKSCTISYNFSTISDPVSISPPGSCALYILFPQCIPTSIYLPSSSSQSPSKCMSSKAKNTSHPQPPAIPSSVILPKVPPTVPAPVLSPPLTLTGAR